MDGALRVWSKKEVDLTHVGERELTCCIISENVLGEKYFVFTLTGASVLLKYLGNGSSSIC